MKSITKVFTSACCLGLLLVFTGCQSETTTSDKEAGHGHEHGHDHDHDHSDRPESLRAAIVKVKELSESFCAAMDEDDTEAAHDPLHDLGKLLEAMPELAADTDLAEDEWKQVKEEIDRLFDAFGDVDAAFHKKDGDKQGAYEGAKATIEEGVAALEAKLPLLGEDESHADHGHDHEHEHDEGEAHDHEGEAHDHDDESHDHEGEAHDHDEESHDHDGEAHDHDGEAHDDE